MKYGMVAQIRVNPEDCQSVLDMMGVLGIDPYDGRSFAQCVSIAFSSMLGSYREGGVIPRPDSFQYLNRMAPFIDSRNNKRKYVMSEALYKAHGVPTIGLPVRQPEHPGQYVPEHLQQPSGWTSQGQVSTAAVPMQMDETTRQMLEDEINALYAKDDKTTPEENERIVTIKKLLGFM